MLQKILILINFTFIANISFALPFAFVDDQVFVCCSAPSHKQLLHQGPRWMLLEGKRNPKYLCNAFTHETHWQFCQSIGKVAIPSQQCHVLSPVYSRDHGRFLKQHISEFMGQSIEFCRYFRDEL